MNTVSLIADGVPIHAGFETVARLGSDYILPLGTKTWGTYLNTPYYDFAQAVGRTPRLVLTFVRRTENWIGPYVAPLWGEVPVITWEPWSLGDTAASPGILASIIAGEYDTEIISQSKALRDYKELVIIRLMHEMNGNWYPWSGNSNGASTGGPDAYIAAYRHVAALIRGHAGNARLCWSPNSESWPNESWNIMEAYYPGDDVVDIIGGDGYDWGGSRAKSFADIFTPWYITFSRYSKPLLITEIAAADNGTSLYNNVMTGQDKPAWINAMAATISTSMPLLRGFIWFSVDKERLWQVDSSASSLSAFESLIASDWYSAPHP